MKIMNYEDYETSHLDKIDDKLSQLTEMRREEREFLNGLIRYHKPKKILEVGVSAGASSLIMLNAADYGAEVHSIDYVEDWYHDSSKKSGFLATELAPTLAAKWHLYSGTIAAKFMDEIGGDIDFCLLDAAHINPGEFLDFLMVFPYLKPDAIIVLHDVSIHARFSHDPSFDPYVTCGTLFSVLRGSRFLPSKTTHEFFADIGAIKLAPNLNEDLWPFFHLLTLPWKKAGGHNNWDYLKPEEWRYLETFIARHYPAELQTFFQKILAFHNLRKAYTLGKSYTTRKKYSHKHRSSLKTAIKFIKSYFLFPWYVYKTYKKLG